jgi:hypothetical protein
VLLLCLAVGQVGCDPPKPIEGNTDTNPPVKVELSVAQAHSTKVKFLNRAVPAGVNFTPGNGQQAGHFSILESLGSGVALFDYDRDGHLDVFAPGGGTYNEEPRAIGLPPALFRNEGAWQFTNVTPTTRLTTPDFYTHGAHIGDYDNDGWPDILLTGYRGLALWRNLGDGTFDDVTDSAGLTERVWSTTAAWGDLDGDGLLDLYVTHYVDWSFQKHPLCFTENRQREVCSPGKFQGLVDAIYRNVGDGTFEDKTKGWGVDEAGMGLSVILADVDLDSHLDVYVANDTTPNLLYRNQGNGKLNEIGIISGTALSDSGTADGSMGIAVGDANRDGRPDLFVANYEAQFFALYQNLGETRFDHVSTRFGITNVGNLYVGFGTAFLDFDADGDEDLFVTNGHVMRQPSQSPEMQSPLVLENLSGAEFVNVSAQAGIYCQATHMGRGLAVGDIDGDGDQDLAVSHMNQPLALLSNETPLAGAWLRLRLIGTQSNRDAVGATVIVTTDRGVLFRQITGGGSYLSSSAPEIFIGLGNETIKTIEIRWPAGETDTIDELPANRSWIVRQNHIILPDP